MNERRRNQLPYLGVVWFLGAIAIGALTHRPGATVLMFAGAILCAAVVLVYRAVATLLGERSAPVWAYEAATTDTQELGRERDRLLQALKDLEYEREVHKISEPDFAAQQSIYQSQLVAVMSNLDKGLARYVERAERDIRARLEGSGPAAASAPVAAKAPAASAASPRAATAEAAPVGACPACGTALAPDSVFCKKCGARVAPVACAACGTRNDPDSVFCKKCGKRVAPA